MESPQSRATCMYCLEPINPGARRCPRCSSWQSRWAADSANPRLELTLVVAGAVVLAGLVLVWALLGPGRAALSAQDPEVDLVVTAAELVPPEPGTGARTVVVGTIANRGRVGWRSPYLHVELYDAAGELVDNFSARPGSLAIPAGTESSFKVIDRTNLADPARYARCVVEVRAADRIR